MSRSLPSLGSCVGSAWGRVSGEKPQARGHTAAVQLPSLHASGIAACSRHVHSNVRPRALILAAGRTPRGEPPKRGGGRTQRTPAPHPNSAQGRPCPYLRRSPGSPETLPGCPANPEPMTLLCHPSVPVSSVRSHSGAQGSRLCHWAPTNVAEI